MHVQPVIRAAVKAAFHIQRVATERRDVFTQRKEGLATQRMANVTRNWVATDTQGPLTGGGVSSW